MLTLLATPIGNLGDISYRAVEALKGADIVACEDTRVTEKLYSALENRGILTHDSQKRRYISYHKHNEAEQLDQLITFLNEGKNILLVSDAGTPSISDPGQRLVHACHIHQIPVTLIPGPCAFVSAIALSGFSSEKMQFLGFLPKEEALRKITLRELCEYHGISSAYETPERVQKTVDLLCEIAPTRPIALIRELTKKFEEVLVGKALDIQKRLHELPIKGEITLVIHPPIENEPSSQKSIEELILEVQIVKKREDISLSEACQLVAKAHGVKKGWLYGMVISHS